ncbi:MAG: HAD-IA family hydrolase [Synechococcales bacterium]|nr:HAD-IA family hydrolase [Synechococcales bacterium]
MKIILFDFDGTIANTLEALLNISNRLAKEFGYPQVTAEALCQLKDLSSRDIIRQAQIPFVKIPFLLRRLKVELNREIETIKPIQGMEKALYQLKQDQYPLGIVTSNSADNVQAFLRVHQLENVFDFVYSGTTIFGKHRVMNRLIRKHQFNPRDLVYVGDETRDIEAAKRISMPVIAVSWGFNSRAILETYQPNFLIDRPEELVEIVRHSL